MKTNYCIETIQSFVLILVLKVENKSLKIYFNFL